MTATEMTQMQRMCRNALNSTYGLSDRYADTDSTYPYVKWNTSADEKLKDLLDKRLEEFTNAAVKNAVKTNKTETKKEEKKENNMNNTVKNVLFLAPGYQYAMTVIANQSKELDRKKIPYNASKDPKNLYISTDKVHVEIVYMDPIKWTPNLFRNRDAFFGKKELVDKARETFSAYINFKNHKSLSKYIRDLHTDPAVSEVKSRETYIPEIKNAYFNYPMTVVLWEDGTKTMVRCQEGDVYSAETGLALCIAKKAMGNMPNFNNVFRKWIPEEAKDEPIVLQVEGVDFAKAIAEGDILGKLKSGIQRAFGYEGV